MDGRTNITALIGAPDALRGLDHLIEHARRVLDRYRYVPLRLPVRKPEEKTLGRTA